MPEVNETGISAVPTLVEVEPAGMADGSRLNDEFAFDITATELLNCFLRLFVLKLIECFASRGGDLRPFFEICQVLQRLPLQRLFLRVRQSPENPHRAVGRLGPVSVGGNLKLIERGGTSVQQLPRGPFTDQIPIVVELRNPVADLGRGGHRTSLRLAAPASHRQLPVAHP